MGIIEDSQRIIAQRIRRSLIAVSAAFVADLKRKVSVPAPRKQLPSGRFVATVPAIPGAPPRVVTGLGRAGISMEVRNNEIIIKVAQAYMIIHEFKNHPWIQVTWDENIDRYRNIFVSQFNAS